MLYQIQARVERTTADGWTSVRDLPTFYLDSNVQGILSVEAAERIARRLLTDAAGDGATVHVFAASAEG